MTETRPDNPAGTERPLRALILEDNPLDAELAVAILKRTGYVGDFEVIDSPEQFQEKLRQDDYDVILADYNLRNWTALDALTILKNSAKDIPFVVSGTLGDEAAVECIKQGASDYVLKHRLERLPMVVDRALRDKAHRVEAARLEAEIRRAKMEWELTFDVVPDPILILNPECRIQRANRAAKTFGLEFPQMIGRFCYEVVHGQSDPLPSCPHQRLLKTGKEEGGDLEEPRLRKTFHSTASPVHDPSRSLQGCVHVMHDVTERKRNEEALRVSEASYRSLILGATYGIFRCDVEGKFVTVNPALVTMLGYESEAELLAANLVNDISLSAGAGAQLLRQKGRVEGMEGIWKRKDGTPITVRLSGRTVLDGQGTLQGFEIIAEDVTARSRLEDQLRQAQKMEAIGQLAGGIAHDFNNLLTIINGYSQLLLDRLDSADACRGFADEVKRAGERAATLTRQLLAFSRRQVLAPQILDLNTVVTGVEKMLQRLIGEDVELVTALDVGLGPVRADPGQIELVILNLAVNARDAMPKGGMLTLETANVELDSEYVETHPVATSGPHVMLAVSDTGCGMDRHTLSHIFEPFFTTKEPGKGTGLGLATVYGIVKQSGGNIWAYSEPGKGTTFKVYLPRVQEAVPAAAPAEGRKASPRGSETILVVEDDAAVRPLVRGVLLSRGYSVLEASGGDEALSVSESHRGPIKLLVTDLVMPGMNGRDLAEQLLLRHPEIRVLYMSGYTNDAIVRQGVLEEGAAFLQKPFTPDALARKVREVLDAPQPARQ
jgi:PAS domain S-box-containing protein